MTADQPQAAAHPAPHAGRVGVAELLFLVFGAPAAWFLGLCAMFSLNTTPCFRDGQRLTVPGSAAHWTVAASTFALAAALAIAVFASIVAWRAYRRTREERGGGARALAEAGAGRTRFLALWGMILGFGFFLATAINALAVAALPRCAG